VASRPDRSRLRKKLGSAVLDRDADESARPDHDAPANPNIESESALHIGCAADRCTRVSRLASGRHDRRIGIWQHARGAKPDHRYGYCTDDVARAIVVDVLQSES